MRKLLAATAIVGLLPLACSSLPPPSARTNPIYHVRHVQPPARFQPVPAATPDPPPPKSSEVADDYYPFSVWWNPNMWPGPADSWLSLNDSTRSEDYALFRRDECLFFMKTADVHYLQPGMGKAPSMRKVAEFERQRTKQVFDYAERRFLAYPVESMRPSYAELMFVYRDLPDTPEGRTEHVILLSDYSVSLGAVARVASYCYLNDVDDTTERQQQISLTQAVADSLTFVRE